MSAMANTTPIVTSVTKTATKEKTPKKTNIAPRVNILDFCEEHYEDTLLVIMDKIRRDKRKEVHTRLDFGDNTKRSRRIQKGSQNSSAETLSARYHNPSERPKVRDRLKGNDGNVFGRLGHRRQSAFATIFYWKLFYKSQTVELRLTVKLSSNLQSRLVRTTSRINARKDPP
ncbi:hypothetical protein Tco_1448101 [Tanacetum coccineum]